MIAIIKESELKKSKIRAALGMSEKILRETYEKRIVESFGIDLYNSVNMFVIDFSDEFVHTLTKDSFQQYIKKESFKLWN